MRSYYYCKLVLALAGINTMMNCISYTSGKQVQVRGTFECMPVNPRLKAVLDTVVPHAVRTRVQPYGCTN